MVDLPGWSDRLPVPSASPLAAEYPSARFGNERTLTPMFKRTTISLVLTVIFFSVLFTSCQQDDPITPSGSSSGQDDHGSGGHGSDD